VRTANSLFAKKEFIELSRKYVCVRIESYESKANQTIVRRLLDGRFENTAFCLLSPDGKTELSKAGRSPQAAIADLHRARVSATDEKAGHEKVFKKLKEVAAKYQPKGKASDAVMRDFDSFVQALNVASSEQRLLVYTVAPEATRKKLADKMKAVANHADVIGRFHFDFAAKPDAKWGDAVTGEKAKTGIFVIQAGEFGQDGKVLLEVPLNISMGQLKTMLLEANAKFAKSEEKKVYNQHITKGRKEGVRYVDELPWGEDKDGDGKIDPERRRR